jgi:phosphotransferase system HPr-like phosphotransfer protein
MIRKEILSQKDFNSRVIANLIERLAIFNFNISFELKNDNENRRINAHSVIGLMSLGIRKNDSFFIYVDNENQNRIDEIISVINEI